MNKIILLFTFIPILCFSQVGINTDSPDSSSVLDITSNNMGVKIPYVNLQSLDDVETVSNPADGLIVYNTGEETDLARGMYIFNKLNNSWGLVSISSNSEGVTTGKTIYVSTTSQGDPTKTVSVGKYSFRVSDTNYIEMSHSSSDYAEETISLVDNVFKSPDTLWYSAAKSVTIPVYGSWLNIGTANLGSGYVINLYFADINEQNFYKVLVFRSGDANPVYSIVVDKY